IYTVMLNPSVDYFVNVEKLKIGKTNRMVSQHLFPGGKGINVSRLLDHLGTHSTALGFLGGFTGEFIKKSIPEKKIYLNFTEINDNCRINLKIKDKVEIEINASGPIVTQSEQFLFKNEIKKIDSKDVIILSGSLPERVSNSFYLELIKLVKNRGR
ncbi:hypothetical protein Q757_06615, partial [Oenococcus alcoholitolerans]